MRLGKLAYRFGLLLGLLLVAGMAQAESATARFVRAALALENPAVVYDSRYRPLAYPLGDVPAGQGVCADVVIRAYRGIGIDLQQRVHDDMRQHFTAYPQLWGLKQADANIDHRRVPNLQVFFRRHGTVLPVTTNAADYRPGDIVTWNLRPGGSLPHIGIVTDKIAPGSGRRMIMHNIGAGQVLADLLFDYPITGHYRYALDAPVRSSPYR